MVTYAEFLTFSPISNMVTEANFSVYEGRAVDALSSFATPTDDATATIFKKAVMYQIEYMAQMGGVDDWLRGSGALSAESYTVGGESESKTYAQGTVTGKAVNGMSISIMAWNILKGAGLVKMYRGVRVCY